ncbi:MAG: NAD(P)/FAD-dependent oxidoreductase [Gammaproteobacteria bacterium]|nr:NAD(P)/FAD-dependent oxidoreductase [Gammaproteobacteria bacterium]
MSVHLASSGAGGNRAGDDTRPVDAIIIGAGISGLYQLYRLRELGLTVRVFEAGGDVGGTWYWNRYPGARFDSESYSYGYSFSKQLLKDWSWSEHFAAQPETLRYVKHVAERFDLRAHIEFDSRVVAASHHAGARLWEVTLADGRRARARFLITAIGVLSAPVMPAIDGLDSFAGEAWHTASWPHHPVEFAGKRVAVIGTGATGVQVIQEVAKRAAELYVFQRTPNWCAPLHNRPITAEEQQRIKSGYDEIFARCRSSHGGFIHNADPRYAMQVSAKEREAFYEALYAAPGFGIWMGNFRDIFTDPRANATISDFVANKIRQRVDDPLLAEKLIPTNHGFGTRRVPLETGYYEVYNQDNVHLVDLRETPIERITPDGVRTVDADHAFDMIIYATGFDAVTGAFDRIDIRGRDGQLLRDKWRDGPRTYLGLQVAGFPNLFTLVGPHNAATFCNIPRCIEQNVEWVTDLIAYMRQRGLTRVEASDAAERDWTGHVLETAEKLLFTRVDSWFMGINRNLPGHDRRTFLLYAGGAPRYREICDDVAANDYQGFVLG